MSQPTDCVFCKIVAGLIPCTRLFETEHVLSFLDIGPLADGHALLVPRTHLERLDECASDLAAEIGRQLPRLARAVVRAVGAEGYNVLQNNGRVAGQVVPHLHFHVIPRRSGDGLGYRWNPGTYAPGRADELAAQIRAALP